MSPLRWMLGVASVAIALVIAVGGGVGAAESEPMVDRPDLVMTAITGPAVAAVGRSLDVEYTVRNQGALAAGPFRIDFYLSSNTTITPGTDRLLGRRTVAGLAPGASATVTTTFTVPATLAVGLYYLGAVADGAGAVVESGEANNVRRTASAIRISLYRPDLVVAVLTVPATGALGRTIDVASTLRNDGVAAAGRFRVSFYLSPDTVINPVTDRRIGSRIVPGLLPGATSTATTPLTIPSTVSPGTYYLAAQADADADVTETAEANNIRRATRQITITPFRPDLVVSALTGPAAARAGLPVSFSNAVRNDGPANAGPFRIDFYLSADTTVTPATDRLLGSRGVTGLAAGATSAATTTLTIPANLPAGTYYLGAKVDAGNAVAEIAEANNLRRAVGATTITLFRPVLAITKTGAGAGIVSSSPGGISCGGDCEHTYAFGSMVTLSAVASAGSVFSGWSGGGCAGSAPCAVTLTRNTTINATFTPGSGGVIVTSLSAASLPPARLLTITGPAFDTTARLSALFSGDGRSVEVPAVQATSTSLVVPVPPFLDRSTSQMVAGNVNVQVVEDDGGALRLSNALGFRIMAGPAIPLPAGRVTLSFLNAARAQAMTLLAEPLAVSVLAALGTNIDNLGTLIVKVQSVVADPAATFTLGTIHGTTITIGAAELRATDQMIVAMLQALAQPPAPGPAGVVNASATGCLQPEAAAAAQAALTADNADLDPFIRDFVMRPRTSVTCRTASAFNTTYLIVGGAGAIGIGILAFAGAPALALALPTAAILYVTIAGAGGEIAIGGALGQTTAGAGQLVQQGVERLDGILQDLVGAVLPDAGGDFVDIVDGIGDVSDGFTNSPLPPPGPPPPPPPPPPGTQCCIDSGGCPGETGSQCGATCCCCGAGQRCCSDSAQGCCFVGFGSLFRDVMRSTIGKLPFISSYFPAPQCPPRPGPSVASGTVAGGVPARPPTPAPASFADIAAP